MTRREGDEFDFLRLCLSGHQDGAADGAAKLPPASPYPIDESDEVIPDDLVDAMLDDEVPANKLSQVRDAIRKDPAAEQRFNKTNQILDLLRHTHTHAHAPDLTQTILARVECERSLLGRFGVRRLVTLRYAAAAALALLVGASFVAQSHAPQALTLVPRPTPVNDLVNAIPEQTAGVMSTVENAVNLAGEFVPAQLQQARLRDTIALNEHQSSGAGMHAGGLNGGFVPPMNPRIAAVLWMEPSAAGTKQASTRLCGETPCQSRRAAASVQQVSLRAIFADDARSTGSDDTLVAFRR